MDEGKEEYSEVISEPSMKNHRYSKIGLHKGSAEGILSVCSEFELQNECFWMNNYKWTVPFSFSALHPIFHFSLEYSFVDKPISADEYVHSNGAECEYVEANYKDAADSL